MSVWLPAPLRPGDRVRLVAASSALAERQRLEAGIAVLEGWGLKVELPFTPERRWGYLAGRDHERLADLLLDAEATTGELTASVEPAALLACVRGGWGAARLLEQPLPLPEGWLLGFSDVTSLLLAQQARGLRGAVHGPMVTTLAAEPPWSQDRLHRLLFGEAPGALQGTPWQGGQAEGPLLVANLTVATHLLGTEHLPDLRGAVLILEDVGEAPYRIERMLTHWRLCGALQQLAGIGFGSFQGCEEPDKETVSAGERFSLEQVLRERTADLGIPVLAGLPVGHEPGNGALPLGVPCRLDGECGELSLLL
ncbi:LD-carboxypeptidase [Synechococcus sp. EJ6-Ellesmere]|uniref:S66 peptidase family protein n=1 Tax=Synechococcus sp. EJ6-Ellesmere TaxID=2823734 RepID=UPI0020CFAE66|nr:LD-carboxypeptidase [Synechococcus sp. EJ6-Ellesmere]MCP9826649.1 LD-carboxypeptidase [Synechococcus sp. EJ6-Ellesmere]